MKKITWLEFETLIKDLSGKILVDKFNPTILIALARGGWVPTRFLSNSLKIKQLASIGLTYSDETRTNLVSYSFPEPIGSIDKILLIEDRLETGRSLVEAKKIFELKGAEVKTACLYIRSDSIIRPDYFLDSIDENIIFPWE
jgi:uncharacterized protein